MKSKSNFTKKKILGAIGVVLFLTIIALIVIGITERNTPTAKLSKVEGEEIKASEIGYYIGVTPNSVYATFNTDTGELKIESETVGQIDAEKWLCFKNGTDTSHMLSWFSASSIKTITFVNRVIAPTDSSKFFLGCSNLTTINNINNLDVTYTQNMSEMFFWCNSLVTLDLSGWSTTYVKDISSMFSCDKLEELNLSGWNLSKVTDMKSVFSNNPSLKKLNLSGWNVSNVTTMELMFNECKSLTNLNISGWNTSKVTNMYAMFNSCKALTSLDTSSLNTSSVTNMSYMFNGCSSLANIDLRSWNVSNVTNMNSMFCECSSLTNFNITGWNTSNVTDMRFMFYGCSSLNSLNISSLNTSKVTEMTSMFRGCSSLKVLDLSNFNTSNVTSMSEMFRKCSSLTSINVSSFDTSKVDTLWGMFSECSSLKTLNLSSFDMSASSGIGYGMFDATSLNELRTPKKTSSNNMCDLGGLFVSDSGDSYTKMPSNLTSSIRLRKGYSITYVTNDGTINSGNVGCYVMGVGATLPTDVTRTGYTFKGWFDNSAFTGTAVTSIGTTAAENKTFYAKWERTSLPTINSFVSSNTNWTNEDLTLTGKAIESSVGLVAYQFSTDGSLTSASTGWETIENIKTEITEELTVTENGTYYFYIKDAEGYVCKESVVVNNLDKVAPTMTAAVSSDIGFNNLKVTSSFTDTLSGLSKIKAYYKKVDDTEYLSKEEVYTELNGATAGAIVATSKTIEIDELDFNTNYKVYLEGYDVAGNSVQTEEIEITFEHAVASIEHQGYATLQEAIDAVPTDGTETEIIMRSNTVEHLRIEGNRNIVLDVNGFIIRGSLVEVPDVVGSVLQHIFGIIGDGEGTETGTESGDGTETGEPEPTILIGPGSKLKLKGEGKVISEDSSAVVNNGEFILDPSVELISNSDKPTLDNKGDATINGGKIHSENGTAIVNDGDLELNGGTITNNSADKPTIDNGGNLTMNGGRVENLAGGTGIYNRKDGVLELNGGTIVGQPAVDNTEGGEISIGDDVEIVGDVDLPNLTVVFKNGDQIVDTQTVIYGQDATAPTLTKAGYTLSWDKEITNVKEDLEVNAVWTANTNTGYKVEYYFRNKDEEVEGYDLDTARTVYKSGTTDTEATITDADKKNIIGFTYDSANTNNVLSANIDGDGSATLKLYYSRNSYSITYELNSDTGATLSDTYMFGKEYVLTRDITREGYTFKGWYDNPGFTGEEVTKIEAGETGTKYFYAKWTDNKVKLGDINGDGNVTLIDLSLINQAIVGKITLNDTQKQAADINKDGNVTLIDLSLINQVIVGKITL